MLYEFKCPSCNNIWELDQKMNDPHVSTCPNCNHENVPSCITGGSGTCFVNHRNWNPSPGFVDHDRMVNKQMKKDLHGK